MKLLLIDGNSIVNRAFFGIRALSAPDGTPTNGVYGFVTIMNSVLKDEKPDGVIVAFDVHAPTFRHKMFADYKGQRSPMPEDLKVQMPLLKEMLDAMGIARCELAGWEADDILGTLSAKCAAEGGTSTILTGDKDSLQLITPSTSVRLVKTRMGKSETILYDRDVFYGEYGFEPSGMIDLKAVMGDSSDNYKGVAGIGEKTAMALISEYGTVQGIYDHIDDLHAKPGAIQKLRDGREDAFFCRTLAEIVTDAPVEIKPADGLWSEKDFTPALYDLCLRLGFTAFIDRWGLKSIPHSLEEGNSEAADEIPPMPEQSPDSEESAQSLLDGLESGSPVAVLLPGDSFDSLDVCDGRAVWHLSWQALGETYDAVLKKIFSASVPKIVHGAKTFIHSLMEEGLSADGISFDTELAAYLLSATDSDYPLRKLSVTYLGKEEEGVKCIWELAPVLKEKLASLHMDRLYEEIELPLCTVLADMERQGFLVDKKALAAYGRTMEQAISSLESTIFALAGESFNINSPKQLGTILFDKLCLPGGKKTKTGWSTNADVLEKLAGENDLVRLVLEYRTVSKLKSTYCDGLQKVICPDGRVRTEFKNTVTATGRLSSAEPNLQNIPIRTPLGAEIRKMFIASPGKILVDADYSQIELRLLAHISGDKLMQQAFLSGEDIHAVTASQVFGTPLAEVTKTQRSRAKAVNFGIVYGISAFSLAQDIGVSRADAKAYMDAYLEKYHGVRDYMTHIVEQAKADGYVATALGRRRELPELKSTNFNMRSFGERVALNMPIQGTAADIIKKAMVRIYERFLEEKMAARLILQVHDELIVECPPEEEEKVREILTAEMEGAASLAVPLTVSCESGHSWHEAH